MHKSLFPITIAPGIEFRITSTEVQQQRKIRSQEISLLPADNLSSLEKEKQTCTVRANTRWLLLGKVLQGWMPGNLQPPSLCTINPLQALIGAQPGSRFRSGQELQGCETEPWELSMVLWWQSTVPPHGMLLASQCGWCPASNSLHSGYFEWGEWIRILVIT